jgi:hypothetical protein
VNGFTHFGENFSRPPTGKPPTDFPFPAVNETAAQ